MVSSPRIKLIFLSLQLLEVIIRIDNRSARHCTTSKSYPVWRSLQSTLLFILSDVNNHASDHEASAGY